MKIHALLRHRAQLAALAVAVLCLAQPATAQIALSVHDLNVYAAAPIAMPEGRICVACHTPHNANSTVAPLWNHAASGGGHSAYPSGGSIQAVDLGAPAGVSLLCLSCHDGSAALDAFGAGTQTVGAAAVTLTGTTLVGMDLSNDHPVSFTFDAILAAADGELNNPTTTASGLGGNIDTDMLFGAGNDQMECASCHDVHNGAGVVGPLLRKSNASSELCITCHNL